MLKLQNVDVFYQGIIRAVEDISLEVGEGQIISLLGANGAGKSSILKAISGLLVTENGKVTKGEVIFEGQRIEEKSPEEIVQLGITQVMEGRRIFPHFSVEENLKVGAYSVKNANIPDLMEMVYTYFPKLKDMRKRTAGFLSGGEQQMLVVGSALMAKPKILLLDEPSLGLAPLIVQEIFQIVDKINKEEGISTLLVEQNARAALQIAEYGYVLENGRLVLEGEAANLRENEEVKKFYLGIGAKASFKDIKRYRNKKELVL
jgi:branched-chain amino acid transport system ATP-binding protein